jgi:hypothetical protein
MLLQNIDTSLPNYKVTTHKTIILILTAVRTSDIIWTELAWNRAQWLVFVITVVNLHVP